ncbi:remorin 1.4-like [Impatiens glandulifera]|uniref:remorin 1.4-like n=1 Tax=Impatiens glandulifera TaxID=253017 RepID=UPI001FB0895B|nr:remorin 1.4-like [Impatiens glandulifera]
MSTTQDYYHATALAAAAFAVKSLMDDHELRIIDQKDKSSLSKTPSSIINYVKSWDKGPSLNKTRSIRRTETEADKWEKAQMGRIEEKYSKMKAMILDWEKKKKGKVKHNKAVTESELDCKRSNAMQHYREQIDRIEKITGRARAQTENNERNEKLKVGEKANKIRKTGKLPAANFLFICF